MFFGIGVTKATSIYQSLRLSKLRPQIQNLNEDKALEASWKKKSVFPTQTEQEFQL